MDGAGAQGVFVVGMRRRVHSLRGQGEGVGCVRRGDEAGVQSAFVTGMMYALSRRLLPGVPRRVHTQSSRLFQSVILICYFNNNIYILLKINITNF
jgi:hypothetical protein